VAPGSRRTLPDGGRAIASPGEAEQLIAGVLDTIAALERLLAQETSLIRNGRIADALAHEPLKSDLAGQYMRELETLKANAIALARFAPAALETLKATHGRFSAIIDKNQAVLATARAVSESLIRSLAEEVGSATRPAGYAPASAGPRPVHGTTSLILSKKL